MVFVSHSSAPEASLVREKASEHAKVCIIGTGYVGLVTGVVFSDLGNEVTCVDADQSKVDMLNHGQMPIYEPGLEELVRQNTGEMRLSFTSSLADGVRESDIIFIAVGTPPGPNGDPDLSQVTAVAHGIAAHINSYKVIVNKSTVPVGTGNLVREIIEKNKQKNVEFDVVSNPEFLREGSAIHDTLYPDRIVIGAPSHTVAMKLLKLYAPLERPMLITDVTSAEIIKYASNAFLASKISFINAIASLCEEVGGDVVQVAKGMGYDKRIGSHFLEAGLGFGGSCFGKDVKALVHTMTNRGCDCSFIKSTLEINDQLPARFVNRLDNVLGGLAGKKIGILGLAFKPDTDDMRDAKSIDVIGNLLAKGATVMAYDPIAMDNCRKIFPGVTYCSDPYAATRDASAAMLITEWKEFGIMDLDEIRRGMASPVIFDGRNMYDPQKMQKLGFEYHCIGRAAGTLGIRGYGFRGLARAA